MFLDLNRFKQINDSRGHSVGDKILVLVGRRLQLALRKSDLLARIGGDEFCILLSTITEEHDVEHVVDKIQESMKSPLNMDGEMFQVSVSIGVATYPTNGDTIETLMQGADSQMYRNKRRTGSNFEDLSSSLKNTEI